MFETSFISKNIVDLMKCEVDNMDVEILDNYFTIRKYYSHSIAPYSKCIYPTKEHMKRIQTTSQCQDLIRRKCGTRISSNLENRCHLYFDMVHKSQLASSVAGFPPVKDYINCVQPRHEMIKQCLPHLKQACQKANIHVMKVIRLSFDMIDRILRQLPNTYVIHFLRDPRSIISSRFSRDFFTSTASPEHEASLLCKKMAADIKKRQILEARYPGQFITVYYEELVRGPFVTVQNMYSKLGTSLPSDVRDFIDARLRTNKAYRSIDAWRYDLTYHDKKRVELACQEVLQLTKVWDVQ